MKPLKRKVKLQQRLSLSPLKNKTKNKQKPLPWKHMTKSTKTICVVWPHVAFLGRVEGKDTDNFGQTISFGTELKKK